MVLLNLQEVPADLSGVNGNTSVFFNNTMVTSFIGFQTSTIINTTEFGRTTILAKYMYTEAGRECSSSSEDELLSESLICWSFTYMALLYCTPQNTNTCINTLDYMHIPPCTVLYVCAISLTGYHKA